MSKNPVIFNNTVLRDGHQSLAATRMSTKQMLPILEDLDNLGFGALETWGGATIDSGLRFLDEFPFKRLDSIKERTPKTKHMMLLRGQNIVAYAHNPDDVVTAFCTQAAKHGMDIFRVFDALNDVRNLETAVRAVKAAGKHAQGTICYTTSPVHTIEKFIEQGIQLEEIGCDSICIKDMAGLIPPFIAYDIIKGLKSKVKIPINIHTHETAGVGAATYYASVDAGVDMIDTSIVPFANGTGQPDTARMISILERHPRRNDSYDRELLMRIREYLEGVYKELSDYTSHKNEVTDSDALTYQVPGGMLSNFRTQLKEFKMGDRFEEVFAEIPIVRKALGWIPLVTPTSQIVGVQSVMNVKFGRWKQFTPAAMDVILGYFGQTPAPVDPEVQQLAAKNTGKDPITCRPADLLDSGMDKLRTGLKEKGLPDDDEHCVIWAMFPQQLEEHYNRKKVPEPVSRPIEVKPQPAAPRAPAPSSIATPVQRGPRRMALTIDGKRHEVVVEELSSFSK